jgi:hypothetical protein
MFLMSVLLSAITFNPALSAHDMTGTISGTIHANVISPDATCKPGAICASTKMTSPRNGCYFNNFYNTSAGGGTPLTIDVTETGSNGSPVYVYWVNATSTAITIKGTANANFYCPRH